MKKLITFTKKTFPILSFHHLAPALKGFLFLSAGIVTADHIAILPHSRFLVFLTFLISFLLHRRSSFLFFVAGLFLLSNSRYTYFSTQQDLLNSDTGNWEIRFKDPPRYKSENGYVQDIILHSNNIKGCATVKIASPLTPGEKALISGTFTPFRKSAFPWNINYSRRGIVQNVHGKIDSMKIVSRGVHSSFTHIVHNTINRTLESYSPFQKSILSALYLANKSEVTSDKKFLLRYSGTSHLLALSGLHVATLLIIFGFILKAIPIPKPSRSFLLVFVPWFWVLIWGFSPSIIRALTMSSLIIGAIFFKRPSIILNSIGAAGILLLCTHPYHLFSPGFLFSFSAVLCIVITVQKISSFPLSILQRKIAILLSVPLVASIGTLPISLYFFHEASLSGIIINIFATPIFSSIFMLTTLLLPFSKIHFVMIFISTAWRYFFEFLHSFAENLQWDMFTYYNAPFWLFSIPLVIILTIILNKKKILYLIPIIIIPIMLLNTIWLKERESRFYSESFYVFNCNSYQQIKITSLTNYAPVIHWLCRKSSGKTVFVEAKNDIIGQLVHMLEENGSYSNIYFAVINPLIKESNDIENGVSIQLGEHDSTFLNETLVYPIEIYR